MRGLSRIAGLERLRSAAGEFQSGGQHGVGLAGRGDQLAVDGLCRLPDGEVGLDADLAIGAAGGRIKLGRGQADAGSRAFQREDALDRTFAVGPHAYNGAPMQIVNGAGENFGRACMS